MPEPTTPAVAALVAAVEAALADPAMADPTPADAAAMVDAMRPAMAALLAHDDPLPAGASDALEGEAVGNLLHQDEGGRFHLLAVVFPEGTSSGVHHHGCWGLIGYLRGGDEETRYRPAGGGGGAGDVDGVADLEETSRHVWHTGDITALLPPEDGWHRVRNPGPGPAVSVHVLCRTPPDHPHHFWDRSSGRVLPYPFVEAAPGRWRARVEAP